MTTIRQFYLLKLIEECSEVAQQAAKQMQFGHFSTSQTTGKRYDNTALLRAEVNDILATLDVLMDLGELPEISPQELLEAKNKKRNRIMEYLRHSQALGLVEKDFRDYGAVEYPRRYCGCREYPEDGDACLLPNNHQGPHDWQSKDCKQHGWIYPCPVCLSLAK
jgi:hypothetical protein